MNLNRRYQRQIENLISVFEYIEKKFLAKKPIDRELSQLFRKNSHFGSKDRRFISGAIFGYFRWYGWLIKIDSTSKSLQLLLGYLLDGNPVSDLIRYWFESFGLSNDWIQQFGKTPITLNDKLRIISTIIPTVERIDLNPGFVDRDSSGWIEDFQSRPKLWVRLLKPKNERFFKFLYSKGIEYHIHEKMNGLVRIDSPVNLHESIDFRQGQLEVQDISSQCVGYICQPKKCDIWWDVCAGSGGKSLHLAALMKGRGTVLATEINPKMYKELKRRISKNKNLKKIHPIFWDGEKMDCIHEPIQGVLVDAPCSCSGTWRRVPDLRWSTSEHDIEYFSKLQKGILARVSSKVPVNGELVYSTCSIFHQENEKVIENFLKQFPEFSLVEITHPYTGRKSKEGIYLVPPEVDGNGMFVAKMIRS